jgi:hypothetical protein
MSRRLWWRFTGESRYKSLMHFSPLQMINLRFLKRFDFFSYDDDYSVCRGSRMLSKRWEWTYSRMYGDFKYKIRLLCETGRSTNRRCRYITSHVCSFDATTMGESYDTTWTNNSTSFIMWRWLRQWRGLWGWFDLLAERCKWYFPYPFMFWRTR